jgi:hypothetical protein
LFQGPSGSGKTHALCSFPQPIVVGVTETNLAVIQGFAEGGVDITAYPLTSWTDYEWFVRRTKNREWKAQTVALDTYGLMGERLVLQKMADGTNTKNDGNLKISVWNHVKNDQWTQIMDFVSSTQAIPGKPAYHIVVCSHEREEYERKTVGGGAEGPVQDQVLVGVRPDAPGSFRDTLGARFDCVFITAERPVREKGANNVMRVVGSEHILWTVPPDHLRHTKDGVGGKGGRKVLPPTVENTFPALCAGWGMDPAGLEDKP